MRIAICLSGHTRNYWDSLPNKKFEADTFISSCIQSGLPPDDYKWLAYHLHGDVKTSLVDQSKIIDTYNPIKYEFIDDNHIPSDILNMGDARTSSGCFLKHVGMMFYRIHRANLLKMEYEAINGFKYDYVLRSRFDVKVEEINPDTNKIFAKVHDGALKDIFFFSESHIMDKISDCYLWFCNQSVEYLSSFKDAENILLHYVLSLNLGAEFNDSFWVILNKDPKDQNNVSMEETFHINNGDMGYISTRFS